MRASARRARPPRRPRRGPSGATRALIPKQRLVAGGEVAQQLRPLRLGVRVARGDRAAHARVQQPQRDAARESQRAALPAVLGPGAGVELDVHVRAEAAQVERRGELRLERGARRLDGQEQAALEVLDAGEVAAEPDGAAEVVLQRAAQPRVVPARTCCRRARSRARGAASSGRRPRRARTGRRRATRAAAAPRARSAASTRPCARAAPRGCGRRPRRGRRRGWSARARRHRLHGPAPQLEHAAGRHHGRIGRSSSLAAPWTSPT